MLGRPPRGPACRDETLDGVHQGLVQRSCIGRVRKGWIGKGVGLVQEQRGRLMEYEGMEER